MSTEDKAGSGDATEEVKVFCQCSAPMCASCGGAVDTPPSQGEVDVISEIEDVEKLLHQYVEDADIGMDEVRRVYKYIRKSFHRLFRNEINLSQLVDRIAIIRSLCQEVGANNMEPFIAFVELLSVSFEHTKKALACTKLLKRHQIAIARLSPCIECTSPPTTPTRPPVLIGSKTYYLYGNVSKVSPSPSPPSGNSPVTSLNILPSDILKFSGEIHSHFDVDFN